jgi:MATE family multidrug resistance protein
MYLLPEFKKTIKLSLPLILSNVAQIGLGLIDSAMVGAIDYKQLAASSLVINAIAIPQVVCIGFTIAITALVSISRGQQNTIAASGYLYNGVWLSTALSVVIALACTLSATLLAHLGQDPEIVTLATPYFYTMAWGLIPMTLFLSFKQFSDALELTQTGMILAVLSLPLNAILNWIFIYGHFGIPRLELLGAGIATFLTRVVEAIAMIIIVFRHPAYRAYLQVRKKAWRLNGKAFRELSHMGIPSSLQLVMEAGAFSVSGIMVGWLGATAQAAHQIALNLATATFMAVLGLSMGSSIRVSHAFGAADFRRLSLIGKSTIAGGLAYGLTAAFMFVALRHQLTGIFTQDSAVMAIAAQLLLVAAVFQVSDSLQAIGAGLCRGIKDVKIPTLLVAIAYWGIGIPMGYWLAFSMQWGASGIWWGFVVGLSFAAILLNTRFIKTTARHLNT